ncbi:MAG: hypothetical protein IJC33_00405, partial [Clostridia bacterium]|nr:hypothetical protein [Clostridia bacterium]
TTTAANIKIVPQTLIIKGTSVNNSKTFISVQKNQQIEAINHKTLTFFHNYHRPLGVLQHKNSGDARF